MLLQLSQIVYEELCHLRLNYNLLLQLIRFWSPRSTFSIPKDFKDKNQLRSNKVPDHREKVTVSIMLWIMSCFNTTNKAHLFHNLKTLC